MWSGAAKHEREATARLLGGGSEGALLAQETREALGVELKGSIVVVDEAHNLVAAVNSSQSASIALGQLRTANAQLDAYYQRFQARLAPGGAGPGQEPCVK